MQEFNSLIKLNPNSGGLKFLKLGITALAISGLLSIFLVVLRMPINSDLGNLFFKKILITHVNLSVTIWLIAVGCSILSENLKESFYSYNNTLFILAVIGVILITISPFKEGAAILNNYIPILDNLTFILGFALFITSALILALMNIVSFFTVQKEKTLIEEASFSASLILIVAFFCFVISTIKFKNLNRGGAFNLENYYELVFWGMGHVLQFFYVQIIQIIWLIIVDAQSIIKRRFLESYKLLMLLNFILTLPCILISLLIDIESPLYKTMFTEHMRYFCGITPTAFIILLLIEVFLSKKKYIHPLEGALFSSQFLFLFGGILGILISGSNVTIPAHYHGSNVGISIGIMGYGFYYIFFLKNYKIAKGDFISSKKLYFLQPLIYMTGQIIHISALAVAGGYGVIRKKSGIALTFKAKVAMGVMGVGGLIAVIGGLMFIVICVKDLFYKSKSS